MVLSKVLRERQRTDTPGELSRDRHLKPGLWKCIVPVRFHEGNCLKSLVIGHVMYCQCESFKLTLPRAPLLLTSAEFPWGTHSSGIFAVYRSNIVLLLADEREPLVEAIAEWSTG